MQVECTDLRPHTKILVSRDTIINAASLALIFAVHSRSLRFCIRHCMYKYEDSCRSRDSFLANSLPAVGRQMLLSLLLLLLRSSETYYISGVS